MEDPRAIIAREPMHYRQVLTVATATALNALDGFDVLSISFASPGIEAPRVFRRQFSFGYAAISRFSRAA
ncbi:hypothetical protein [Novosphingobium sp. ST904]|uniref:hypothetical protein n=1 Tax=Novosphingobium sp. ST904 TaxID=1684385 RepID=UPI0009E7405E|nr:hypothetical protein [Novosphingobium sp. ST904]TCM26009.1 hypothetical protein EDF59_1371 [Novosphingobium sp. ST904]